MTTYPIDDSIDLSVNNSKIIVNNADQLGYSFDLNIDSGNAAGNIKIYLQNSDPITDTHTRTAYKTFVISGGTFQDGVTSQLIDSAFLTTAKYCVVIWQKTSGTGTLTAVGTSKIFS